MKDHKSDHKSDDEKELHIFNDQLDLDIKLLEEDIELGDYYITFDFHFF